MPPAETGRPSASSRPDSGRIGPAWLLQIRPLEAYGNLLSQRPTVNLLVDTEALFCITEVPGTP